jgi:hypothetical protein
MALFWYWRLLSELPQGGARCKVTGASAGIPGIVSAVFGCLRLTPRHDGYLSIFYTAFQRDVNDFRTKPTTHMTAIMVHSRVVHEWNRSVVNQVEQAIQARTSVCALSMLCSLTGLCISRCRKSLFGGEIKYDDYLKQQQAVEQQRLK